MIDGQGRFEIEVVGVEAKQSQDAAGLAEVAADHTFEDGNLPAIPAFEIRSGKQVHFHEKRDRCDEALASKDA